MDNLIQLMTRLLTYPGNFAILAIVLLAMVALVVIALLAISMSRRSFSVSRKTKDASIKVVSSNSNS